MKTVGAITTALAVTNAKVDSLTTYGVTQWPAPEEQPGFSWPIYADNPLAATSTAESDQASMEEHVRIQVIRRMRSSYPSFLAITDDESHGEEVKHPQLRRRTN